MVLLTLYVMWFAFIVMLQLLTGEPLFEISDSEHENKPLPLYVRLGIDETLDDKSKALKVIFENKETVAKIRNAVSIQSHSYS